MAKQTVRVKNLKPFLRAVNKAEKETKKKVHAKLREAADVVRQDAKLRFQRHSVKSASGYRIRSRVGGVFVEQSLRKTTGHHPEYGTFQMVKALEPALDARAAEVERRLEEAMDELADIVD